MVFMTSFLLFWFESNEMSPVKLLLWGGLGSFSRSCENVTSSSPEVSRFSSDSSNLARRFLFASAVLVMCWTGRIFKVFGVRKFCLCTQSEVWEFRSFFGIFLSWYKTWFKFSLSLKSGNWTPRARLWLVEIMMSNLFEISHNESFLNNFNIYCQNISV